MAYDCNQITTRIYCGSLIHSLDDVRDIKNLGITHIIDCCEQDDDPLIEALVPVEARSFLRPGFTLGTASGSAGLAYLFNPTADDGQPKPTDWFERSIDFAMGALAHPQRTVLTHCAAGVNRGPSTAYAIMRALGWAETDAIVLLHTMRPVCVSGVRYADDADRAVQTLGWV